MSSEPGGWPHPSPYTHTSQSSVTPGARFQGCPSTCGCPHLGVWAPVLAVVLPRSQGPVSPHLEPTGSAGGSMG